MELIEYAFASGDGAALRTASDSDCVGCNNFLTGVADADAAGEIALGADIKVLEAVSPALVSGETTVDLRYERAAGTVVNQAGLRVTAIAAQSPTNVQITVSRRDIWVVSAFTKVEVAS